MSTTTTLLSLADWERERPFLADSIAVQNLQCIIHAGRDIWGRSKPQPVTISARIALTTSFSSAASTDTVDISTVHYGTLSKAILETVNSNFATKDAPDGLEAVSRAVTETCIDAAGGPSSVGTLDVTISLPKGSRHGHGTSLTISQCPANGIYSSVLALHKLSVPCIIGVNEHERLLKQLVLASIWLDACSPWASKAVPELEQLVVKTIEESSYQTLEALAEELAARVIKYFIFSLSSVPYHSRAGIRIRLEKPSAVPLADAPAIEIFRSATDQPYVGVLLSELGTKHPKVPFPLTGRLDEFLQSWKQD